MKTSFYMTGKNNEQSLGILEVIRMLVAIQCGLVLLFGCENIIAADLSLPDQKLKFNGCESFEQASFRSGVFEGKMTRDNAILNPTTVDLHTTEYPYLAVLYKIDKDRSGSIGAYFTTDSESALSDSKSNSVSIIAKSDAWQTAVIPLKLSPKYVGVLRTIRVDFGGKKGDVVKVAMCVLTKNPDKAVVAMKKSINSELGVSNSHPEYVVKLSGGATGTARQRGDSILIKKSNALGELNVQFKIPYTVRANANYIVRCEYQSELAFQNTILMLRATQRPSALPSLNFAETLGGDFWLWANYSSIRNTPVGKWDHRFTSFRSTADANEVYVNVVCWGNPFNALVRNIEVFEYPEPTIPVPPLLKYDDTVSQEDMLKILDGRNVSDAKVGEYKGRKVVLINDGIEQGIGIYKGWTEAGTNRGLDIANFGKMGVNLVVVKLTTGKDTPNSAEGFWIGDKQYDFSKIDDVVYKTLRLNPQANIILELYIRPYQFWYKNHPEGELAVNGKGERAFGPELFDSFTSDRSVVERAGSGKHWVPSWSSRAYQNDVKQLVADTVEYIKKQPYAKVVVGAHLAGGDDGQFGATFHDHSTASQREFRFFLKRKYDSIENLNSIWGGSLRSFEDVGIADEFIEDWSVSHQTVDCDTDYREFSFNQVYSFRDDLAKTFKESFQKPVIVTTYGFPSGDYFSELKWIDAFCFQPGYFQRRAGYVTNNFPRTLFHRADKLFITEFDTRGNGDPNFGDSGALFYNEGVGWEASLDDWKNSYMKLIGQSITKGYQYWYYDMYQYYNTPGFRAAISAVQTTVEKLYEKVKTPFKPDVCVVMSHRQTEFATNWLLMTEHINHNPQYQEFELSGVPMDKLYLSEIRRNKNLSHYKVFIFFQNSYISADDRDFIENELKSAGRTLIWIYNPGYIGERGIDIEGMQKLIGMQISHQKRTTRLTPLYNKNASFMESVPELFSGVQWLCTILPNLSGWEPFRIEEEGVEVLARYKEDGTVAAALKKNPKWTSIYFASPQSLHGQLLHNIAKSAGCYVAGDYGQQLDIDSGFASVHGVVDNPNYKIRLPVGKSKVREALTGALLQEGEDEYEFPVEPWKTYWFLFE